MKKDLVFELIKQLSTGERREFTKLHSKGKKSPDFYKFYKYILSEKNWCPQKAQKSLKIGPQRLLQLKSQLKNAVFQYFRFRKSSPHKQLSDISSVVTELIARDHFILAQREINKGKALACELESAEEYSKLIQLESLLPSHHKIQDGRENWAEKLLEELAQYQSLLRLMRESLAQKGDKKLKISLTNEILRNPLLKSEPKFIRAKETFWRIKINGFKFLEKWSDAIYAIECYSKFIEENSLLFPNALTLRLNQLKYLPVLYTYLGNIWERDSSFIKIKMIEGETEIEKANIFFSYSIPEFSKWVGTGLFEPGIEQHSEYREKFARWEWYVNQNSRSQFCFLASYFCLFAGKQNHCRDWARKLIRYQHNLPSVSLYLPFSYLSIAASYIQEEEYESCIPILRSLKHLIESKNLKYQYFQLFYSILKQLAEERADKNDLISALKTAQQLRSDDFESRPFGYFDLTPWLQAKTTGQDIKIIIQDEFADFLSKKKQMTVASS